MIQISEMIFNLPVSFNMKFANDVDDLMKAYSRDIGNRNITKILLFLSLFLVTIVLVGVIFSESFSVYGQPGPLPLNSLETCTNVSVTAINSSGAESAHPASSAIDNNLSTIWSNLGVGSWIQLDLGAIKNMCGVDIAWHKGNETKNNFVISTSNDGMNFSTVFSNQSSGTTLSFEKYNISDTSARHIKITVNGNTKGSYANISEISVNAISVSSNYSIGAAGDWGSARNDNWKKTVKLMIDNKVDLALGLGDYSYGSVKEFQPVVDRLNNSGIPMKGAKGDHDSNTYAKLFGQPSLAYAFDAGPARIILLDPYKSATSNAAFLERELNQTKQPWKIVVTTTPLYTSPSNHKADKDERNALQPLFDKYKVDLAMWGDNHNYERIMLPDKSTVFIQSGTGGESHYNFKLQIAESVYQNDEDFGITKITMNNSTLSGQFIPYSGKILDTFQINK
jgi:hypothetical protein